jgi:hypothetical protein
MGLRKSLLGNTVIEQKRSFIFIWGVRSFFVNGSVVFQIGFLN